MLESKRPLKAESGILRVGYYLHFCNLNLHIDCHGAIRLFTYLVDRVEVSKFKYVTASHFQLLWHITNVGSTGYRRVTTQVLHAYISEARTDPEYLKYINGQEGINWDHFRSNYE